MANDALGLATRKDEECLQEIVDLIQQTTERASRENQRFLVYLLEMAHMEANMLLTEKQSHLNGLR